MVACAQVDDDGADKKQDNTDCGHHSNHWHADADEQSDRASCFEDAKRGYSRFRHACLGHVDEDLLIADEVECGREDVSRSSQESDNDVGDEYNELR